MAGRRRTPRSGSAPGRGGERRRPTGPRPDRVGRHTARSEGSAHADKTAPSEGTERSASTASESANTGAERSTASAGGATPLTDQRTLGLARRRSGLTTRAIALGVVLLLLTISYASSLRVFFDQKREIAATEAEIAQRQNHIEDLQAELERWKDPAYVRAQARERLGWVVPGEIGYRVVGPDGKPIVPGAEVGSGKDDDNDTWWQKLDGSLRAADGPEPAKRGVEPAEQPTAPPRTVGPSPSSTPR